MHRSNFAVEERIFQRSGPRTGPFFGNGRPPPGSPPTSFASKTASSVPQDEATKAQSVSGLPMFGDRFPDSLFAAALAQGAQQRKHDAELIAASTLVHDIGLTAAFTGEVRFEITIGSGLQLDRVPA